MVASRDLMAHRQASSLDQALAILGLAPVLRSEMTIAAFDAAAMTCRPSDETADNARPETRRCANSDRAKDRRTEPALRSIS